MRGCCLLHVHVHVHVHVAVGARRARGSNKFSSVHNRRSLHSLDRTLFFLELHQFYMYTRAPDSGMGTLQHEPWQPNSRVAYNRAVTMLTHVHRHASQHDGHDNLTVTSQCTRLRRATRATGPRYTHGAGSAAPQGQRARNTLTHTLRPQRVATISFRPRPTDRTRLARRLLSTSTHRLATLSDTHSNSHSRRWYCLIKRRNHSCPYWADSGYETFFSP